MSQELLHTRKDVLEIDTGCWRYFGLFGGSILGQLECGGIQFNEYSLMSLKGRKELSRL